MICVKIMVEDCGFKASVGFCQKSLTQPSEASMWDKQEEFNNKTGRPPKSDC
jgi:hypothetical protein